MSGLVFRHRGPHVLKIDARALAKLLAHAQLGPKTPEAGGVLLGRWITGDMSFIVDAISEPMARDRRTRTSFFRSGPPHMRAIRASLRASNHTRGYLGEWHTHPEPIPTPSIVDRRDWDRRLRDDRSDLPCAFFVIVGTSEVNAWVGTRPSGPLLALERNQAE